MPSAAFEVYADRIGEYRFRFTCGDGVARLRASEGYTAKANALKAVESVRKNALLEQRYDFKQNNRGKHFCTVKARNGNILAVSRNHVSYDELLDDVEAIKAEVEGASLSTASLNVA